MGFRDAEAEVVAFFKPLLTEARVASRVPNPTPALFLRVWRTGGAAMNRALDAPILTLQGWALDGRDTEAHDLTARARDLFYASGPAFGASRLQEVSGLYFDPDPATERPRYTFSAQAWLPGRF